LEKLELVGRKAVLPLPSSPSLNPPVVPRGDPLFSHIHIKIKACFKLDNSMGQILPETKMFYTIPGRLPQSRLNVLPEYSFPFLKSRKGTMWPEVATKKESVVSSGYFRKLEGNLLAAGPSLMARETTRGEQRRLFTPLFSRDWV
jgi:hypothetical protein